MRAEPGGGPDGEDAGEGVGRAASWEEARKVTDLQQSQQSGQATVAGSGSGRGPCGPGPSAHRTCLTLTEGPILPKTNPCHSPAVKQPCSY